MFRSSLEPDAPTLDAIPCDRFEDFTLAFQSVFPRSDQFQRFQTYLRGLLQDGERKNIESMSSRLAETEGSVSDLSQALQHFVSKSPWDADRLFATTRQTINDILTDPTAVWIVHDGVFPKKGRHSVGVQRQFARTAGRKLSCQVAVVISQLGSSGYFPLTARLYLPSHWLRDQKTTVERTVIEASRRHVSKAEIALNLIDELRSERRIPNRLVAEQGYATSNEFVEGLQKRGIPSPEESSRELDEVRRRFDQLRTTLGLDHFEGRTWLGWHHHVCMVFAAHTFLESSRF